MFQLTMKGGVYSIGGDREVLGEVSTVLPEESEPPKKKVNEYKVQKKN